VCNRSWVQILLGAKLHNNLGQVVHTYMPMSPSRYNLVLVKEQCCSAAGKVMAAYCQVDDLVTCGLTACTLGSATGPTFSKEYRKPLPFTLT